MSLRSSVFSLLLLGSALASLQAEPALRTWTTRQGSLSARWVETGDDATATLVTSTGKAYSVPTKDLSEADRKYIEATRKSLLGPQPIKGSGLLETDPVFRQTATVNRDEIPIIDQSKYGQKASDCMPSSFCNFLLWWDQTGYLPIGKRGDFDKKAEWIHSKMARLCRTGNNSGTSYLEAFKGFNEYLEKELGDIATVRIKQDFDIRPANLARYTTGHNATLLALTVEQGNSKGGHAVALISAAEDGTVVFHTWGRRITGKIVPLIRKPDEPKSSSTSGQETAYEIRMIPDAVTESLGDTRFILDPNKGDSIIVIKPYVFATRGVRSPPPTDPLFDSP